MEATRIIAIRHGETAWNVDARIQGQLDIPLNDHGHWQAQRLGRALAASEQFAAVYSSDLLRARDTAKLIATAVGQRTVTEPGLRERSFGTFQGQTFAELEQRWPEQTAMWRQRDPQWAPPQGESLAALQDRVLRTTNTLAACHLGQQIVLVAHGGVLDVLYRTAIGVDLRAPRAWDLGNASINRLLWTPQGLTLICWSDTAHLDDEWQDEATA
ncbi:MAG: histidine phosphatase family protein [Rhodoferax sp.]|nr:histidine phosphatase family protein [Rhodoferax sp.]